MRILPNEEIIEIVADIYETHNIYELGFNTIQLCKDMGHLVIPYSSLSDFKKEKFKSYDEDGFSFYNSKINKCFYYNDEIKPYLRTKFTVPHELGHVEMGHIFCTEITNEMNDDANEFSRQLYAPQVILYHMKLFDIGEIMSAFNVTESYANILKQRLDKRLSEYGSNFTPTEIRILETFVRNQKMHLRK